MLASSCGLGLTERTTAEAMGPGVFCVKFNSRCELRFVIKIVSLFKSPSSALHLLFY